MAVVVALALALAVTLAVGVTVVAARVLIIVFCIMVSTDSIRFDYVLFAVVISLSAVKPHCYSSPSVGTAGSKQKLQPARPADVLAGMKLFYGSPNSDSMLTEGLDSLDGIVKLGVWDSY